MTALDAALASLPERYPGPGGAAAVIHEGHVIEARCWGYANAETRRPFTRGTLFRMCSITKQFTCTLLLDALDDPAVLDPLIAARLPLLREPPPATLHLAHNQSGLRDYWGVAMLHGAPAESAFGDVEARRVIAGTRTLQFRPGTSYSYVNQNFRLISDALEEKLGRSFGELLRARIFDRFGMATAFLAAETRAMPDSTEGYEGSEGTGFRPAVNNVYWTGDAGLGASLDDMIAWEQAIDAQRDDPEGFYNRLSAPTVFAEGAPAPYGFGLVHSRLFEREATSHGGALRGWRSHRLHIPSERLSVVVLFNHMSEAHSAALKLAAAFLDASRAAAATPPAESRLTGTFLEEETGLAVRVTRGARGVSVSYLYGAETLEEIGPDEAGRDATRLTLADGVVRMHRPQENRTSLLRRLPDAPNARDIAGVYRCAELEADLTVTDAGGALYGGFSGMLGLGRMERLQPLGGDVWLLPCLRALDHSPPGHWTLAFNRDASGVVTGARVGCWIARNLLFERSL
ncbi:D-aminopeptidase [Acidomonas methanolica]|uniref:D-aminopeptidase n=1 Tax=Acidomonas methanolica TaxID=437 RepID=UPI002119FE68|nr:D-aminopeptidase [Acidomonas methanolica]MCQ9155303.1 D-aminopeptidase [Acidomonas methanolica]